MKTTKSNTDVIIVGVKYNIQLPMNNIIKPTVVLPTKITEVDPARISAIITDVRASHKYKTDRIKKMLSLYTQFDTIRFK